jgi:hypothetical protein
MSTEALPEDDEGGPKSGWKLFFNDFMLSFLVDDTWSLDALVGNRISCSLGRDRVGHCAHGSTDVVAKTSPQKV